MYGRKEGEEKEDFAPADCLQTQVWVAKARHWLRNIHTMNFLVKVESGFGADVDRPDGIPLRGE